MIWYHGTSTPIPDFADQLRYDRARGQADPNAEGPGWYWTSSKDDAAYYGRLLYQGKYEKSLGLLQVRDPVDVISLMRFAESANREEKESFLSNWSEAKFSSNLFKRIIREHYTNGDMLECMVVLYHDLFRWDADRYVLAASSVADGVRVPKKDVTHLVVWRPETIVYEKVSRA